MDNTMARDVCRAVVHIGCCVGIASRQKSCSACFSKAFHLCELVGSPNMNGTALLSAESTTLELNIMLRHWSGQEGSHGGLMQRTSRNTVMEWSGCMFAPALLLYCSAASWPERCQRGEHRRPRDLKWKPDPARPERGTRKVTGAGGWRSGRRGRNARPLPSGEPQLQRAHRP